MNPNGVGKPPVTQEQIDDIFRKLEPYLKTGLSINKACLEAQVPKTTVYDLINENQQFAERVEAAKNYHSVLITDIITKELEVASKMAGNMLLSNDQLKLVQWVALHSSNTREEFRDPKIELPKEEYETQTDEEFRQGIIAIIDNAIVKQEKNTNTQNQPDSTNPPMPAP